MQAGESKPIGNTKTMSKHLAPLSMLLGLNLLTSTACRQDQEFGGGVAKKDAGDSLASRTDNATPVSSGTGAIGGSPSGQTITPPAGCDPSTIGVTQAKLLSTGISRRRTSQSLRYELQVLSCKDGSVLPLKDQIIYFDLHAVVSPGFVNVSYSVQDAKNNTAVNTGILQFIPGSDLFGNTGNYAHWKTETLTYTSNVTTLVLEINLVNIQLSPSNATDVSIDSYLKVGQSKPVTQAIGIID